MDRFYPKDKAKVLFIDDQKEFLNMLKRRLRNEEYEQFYTDNIDEAFQILKTKDIDVVVSDMNMPEMNGIELFKQIKKLYPTIVKIALSGLAQVNNIITAVNEGDVFKYITKPWKVDQTGKKVILEAIDYAVFKKFKLSCEYNEEFISIERLREFIDILGLNYEIEEILNSNSEAKKEDLILNTKYYIKEVRKGNN